MLTARIYKINSEFAIDTICYDVNMTRSCYFDQRLGKELVDKTGSRIADFCWIARNAGMALAVALDVVGLNEPDNPLYHFLCDVFPDLGTIVARVKVKVDTEVSHVLFGKSIWEPPKPLFNALIRLNLQNPKNLSFLRRAA